MNEDVDQETPIFVDRRGVPCAVAYLMLKSGREDLVRQVVETNTYVRIGDLREGPVLDWIRSSGLTQEECARIQPAYRKRRGSSYAGRPFGIQGGQAVSGGWVIPGEYLQRPHLAEPNRVWSHLRHVENLLSRGSAFIPPGVEEEPSWDCGDDADEFDPWLEPVTPVPFAAEWNRFWDRWPLRTVTTAIPRLTKTGAESL